MTQQFYKNMALWLVILLLIVLLVSMLRQKEQVPDEVPYTAFLEKVEAGEVASVKIDEGRIEGTLRGEAEGEFVTNAPPNAVTYEFLEGLIAKDVEVAAEPKRESPVWQQMLIMWFPFLLLIGLWIFFVADAIGRRGRR